MSDLLSFVDHGDNRLISARELHEKLGIRTRFTQWFKRYVEEFDFILNEDYFPNLGRSLTADDGRASNDYFITLSMAEQLCLVQRSPIGKRFRLELLAMKKAFKQLLAERTIGSKNKDDVDLFVQAARAFEQQKRQIENLENKVALLENRALIQDELKQRLLSLPQATDEVPEVSTRSHLNKWITMYSTANDITYSAAWGKFYSEFEMAMHIRLPKENRLDIIEERGLIEKAYAFAQKLYPETQ